MRKKILVILMILCLSVFLSIDVASAGGITKTATEVTGTCPGGGTRTCTGGSISTRQQTAGSCSCGGTLHTSVNTCSSCGATVSTQTWCSNCGVKSTSGGRHGTVSYTCSHGYISSHTVHTGNYQDTSYGYSGSSSTFIVYPITIISNNGITGVVSVSGATATDAVLPGKTVTINLSGVSAGTKIKAINSGTESTSTVIVGTDSYSFTMPAKVTTVTLDLAKLVQTVSVTTPVSKTYNQSSFNLNAAVA